MRIAVDASAALNQGAGIGRYARALIPALALGMPEATITGIVAPDPGADPVVTALGQAALSDAGVAIRTLPITRRRADQLWFRARVPIALELATGPVDLVYSPDFTAPPAVARRSIVTVHDLAFEVVPDFAPPGLRSYLKRVVPRQVRKATRINAVSETTKRDLVERYGVDAEKIAIVSNGVELKYFESAPLCDSARAELGIPHDYLLTVGTIEPRKNHLGIFEALNHSSAAKDLTLVVAGRRGWADDEIVEKLRELEQTGRVIWLDYVPEEHLPGLYAGAAAVIYASWYEGFGLPAIEALAAGAPLVASKAPSLVEIAAGVADFADAASPESIGGAIDCAVSSGRSAGAVEARRMRARRYSWSAAGEALVRSVRDAGC